MPLPPERLIRPELLSLSPYHVPDSAGLIKLDAMENPYPLPEELRAAVAKRLAAVPLNRYPDPHADALKACLRESMAIPAGAEIMVGNGSDEIIQIVALAVARPGAVALSVEPSFVMFRMLATAAGIGYVGVPLREDFRLDPETMLAAIRRHRPAAVFLAYPNNPSGNLFDGDTLARIIEAAPGLVVVDEAYHAFADASFMAQVGRHPNLLVMRTLSKLGLAGLRLGFLAGPPPWITQLEKLRLPYNVNALTQAVAETVLEHPAPLLRQAARIKRDRVALREQLLGLPGVVPFPSSANFILFRVSDAPAAFAGLRQNGILVKNLHGSHPMLEHCLRVTVGTPEENECFVKALRALLAA